MTVSSHNPRGNGFTLIEIMVAVAIASMLLAAMFGILIAVARVNQEIEDALASTRVGPILLAMMAKDLQGCYVPDTDQIFFEGKDSGGEATAADGLDFVSTENSILPDKNGQYADYCEISYVMENTGNKGFRTLYRREDPYIDEEPQKGGKFVELYDYVKRFNIQYYDAEKDQWEDRWDSIHGVPTVLTPTPAEDKDNKQPEAPGDNNQNQNNNDNNQTGQNGDAQNQDKQPTGEEVTPEELEWEKKRGDIRFPDAIKITLEIGIPPVRDDFQPEDVKLQTFETIIAIPAGFHVNLKDDKQTATKH